MDTDKYIQEAERQLSQTDYYVRTETDLKEWNMFQIFSYLLISICF